MYHCDICSKDLVFKKFGALIEHLIVKQSEGEQVTKLVPIVTDPTELVHYLHEKMDLDFHETFLQIGIDAGHGSLKASIFKYYFVSS